MPASDGRILRSQKSTIDSVAIAEMFDRPQEIVKVADPFWRNRMDKIEPCNKVAVSIAGDRDKTIRDRDKAVHDFEEIMSGEQTTTASRRQQECIGCARGSDVMRNEIA
jgi:hypothetical protein